LEQAKVIPLPEELNNTMAEKQMCKFIREAVDSFPIEKDSTKEQWVIWDAKVWYCWVVSR
jgi:hypothetical protein